MICPCPRCQIRRRVAGLVGAALTAEGHTASSMAKRLGTSSMFRAKLGGNLTVGVLADLLGALDYELILQIRKRSRPVQDHQI